MRKFLLLFFIIAIVECKHGAKDRHKLKVTLYYEAHCQYCKEFFTKQLYPAWKNLRGFSLTLIPYGITQRAKFNNQWIFKCHHGPQECYSNMVQGCILKSRTISTSKKVDLINCLMSDYYPYSALDYCAKSLHVSNLAAIKKCADSVNGQTILAEYGEKTDTQVPFIPFVPYIKFNNQYEEVIYNEARKNLGKAICRLSVKKHPNCLYYK